MIPEFLVVCVQDGEHSLQLPIGSRGQQNRDVDGGSIEQHAVKFFEPPEMPVELVACETGSDVLGHGSQPLRILRQLGRPVPAVLFVNQGVEQGFLFAVEFDVVRDVPADDPVQMVVRGLYEAAAGEQRQCKNGEKKVSQRHRWFKP